MSRFFGNTNVKLLRGASLTPVPPTTDPLAGKKYVLVYFSAHWCPPCRAFTPQLKSFYNKYSKAKNFEVVFVSLDKTPAEMASYMETAHGDWLAMDFHYAKSIGENWARTYGVQSIPSLLVFENTSSEVAQETGDGMEGTSATPGRRLITKAGRDMLVLDDTAERFPWPKGEEEASAHKRGLLRTILLVVVLGMLITYALRGAM